MLVLTFPGQGSQHPGMGAAWAGTESWAVVGRASEVAGRDLAALLLDADANELRATRNAQLATYVTSLVVLDALRRAGLPDPEVVAGHSLGEYTALTAAGALGVDDGVRLVTARGEAMQAAADERPGTMAALLGLDVDGAEAACAEAPDAAWVANDNAPGQVVVAGTTEGVATATAAAKARGARKVLALPVGGAFHTPLMASAATALGAALGAASFATPEVPVVANVDAVPHADAEGWPALLVDQLTAPVRWRPGIEGVAADTRPDDLTILEVGPGGVLTGMAKRIVPGVRVASVADPTDVEGALGLLA
ncbi:MAG: ACP S-malonyltransferase [Acidimicrobiia bacterium]|nr:ACP S-malonyltransferase [Acidimicrobiia bacterium]